LPQGALGGGEATHKQAVERRDRIPRLEAHVPKTKADSGPCSPSILVILHPEFYIPYQAEIPYRLV